MGIGGPMGSDAGVTELNINGRRLPVDGIAEAAFSITIENLKNKALIQCRDCLGNQSEFVLNRQS
jgi:hypothetical protein